MEQTGCAGEASEQKCEPVELVQPENREQLKQFLRERLDYSVPDVRVCGHHASPMDYLWDAYSVDLNQNEKGKRQNSGIAEGDGYLNR